MKYRFLLSLAIFLLSLFPLFAQEDYGTFDYEGFTRSYSVRLPDNYDESQPAPLVIALHGAGDDGVNFQISTLLDEIANEHGYISVFPDGLNNGWYFLDENQMVVDDYTNDIGFLTQLIDEVSAKYAVDSERIYLIGFSNGALLALRASCDLGTRFAAVAAVAATFSFELAEHCDEEELASLLLIWGSADEVFPQSGFIVYEPNAGYRSSFSFTQTRTYLRSRYQCDFSNEPVRVETEGATPILRELYSACADDKVALLYAMAGFGHAWIDSVELHLLDNQTIATMDRAIFDFFENLETQRED